MIQKFASPTADSTFKLIFGEEKHKKLTIDFLNSFLERTGDKKIIDIVFMNQEQTPRRIGDRKAILDISCKDQAGNKFIIEIQRKKEYYFDLRALYYAANLLSRQLNETDPYNNLKPVIIIGIANFILYRPCQQAISHHLICDTSTGKQSIDLIELHFIELTKFNKKIDELVSQVDKWIFFIKNAQTLEDIPKAYQDSANIKKAFHLMERAKWTQDQLHIYEKEIREMQRDITQELAEAQELTETFEHGLEQGLEKGSFKKAEETAIKMLKKEMLISDISDLTDLSIDHVKNLQKKYNQ